MARPERLTQQLSYYHSCLPQTAPLALDSAWAPGIGVKQVAQTKAEYWTHRQEVVRCLLACLSET